MVKTLIGTTLSIICVVIGTAIGVTLFVINGLEPVKASDEAVRIDIPKGMNSGEIAVLLEENGLIRNDTVFKYYLRYKNEGERFKAGEYEMKPGIEIDEIITKLNNGETIEKEMIHFTIPEGFNILQMANRLSEKGFVDKKEFLKLADSPEMFSAKAIVHIPDDIQLMHRLEGYLFPETYALPKSSTEKDIITRMLAELDQKLTTLPEDWEQQLKKLGMNLHEILTIASIIEEEVAVDEERAIVSSVIYNRLRIEKKLQVDATVQYALEERKERLLNEHLKVDSAYNTYKTKGLPPGPIASPGIRSIKAALYPDQTEYLFYVTKKDGTQSHWFAETYAEHLQNIRKSKQ